MFKRIPGRSHCRRVVDVFSEIHQIFLTGLALYMAVTLLTMPAHAASTDPDISRSESYPTKSIYQLDMPLTDQSGNTFSLRERRGQPLLISMFYTSCKFVCPMLIEAMQANESRLNAEERARLRILMVSFDPEHDSVAVLRKMAEDRGLDTLHWTLARSDAKSVRKLSAVLGIQYRAIGNGDFNHTTALILVDSEGRIAARSTELGGADDAFVEQIKHTLNSMDK